MHQLRDFLVTFSDIFRQKKLALANIRIARSEFLKIDKWESWGSARKLQSVCTYENVKTKAKKQPPKKKKSGEYKVKREAKVTRIAASGPVVVQRGAIFAAVVSTDL